MDSQMNTTNVITGQKAVDDAAAAKRAKTYGKQTTDRGTLIQRSRDNDLDGSSFLKIMVAEMKNIDPSSSQDNTAYVTQMAQMTTMQQMSDLNKTMSAYSYQALLGKGVTVGVADTDGYDYTGIVKGVSRMNNTWYLSVDVKESGKIVSKVFEASTLKSVLGTTENTSASMLVNSDFMAASSLASNKDNKVVILNTDSKGTQSVVKGTVKSAFLDNGVVKMRVATYDSDGKESTTTTDYPYSSIVKAGNLTDEDMNVTLEDYIQNSDLTAAKALANNADNKVIIVHTDDNGIQSLVKGTVKKAFLQNNVVKVSVATYDSEGKETVTTTDYPYSEIVKSGNLTDADMNVKLEDYTSKTTDPAKKAAAEAKLASQTNDVKGSTSNTFNSDTINQDIQKAQDVQNG
jgi:flagellar basal-body rod modification protein FlgD